VKFLHKNMNEIGIVSGYFNPLHLGHIQYINGAKEQSEQLVVIVNNDHQIKVKGSKPFMTALHRCNIMHSIKGVDFALISYDIDTTVCETLKYIRTIWQKDSMAFFNSGDRKIDNINSAEKDLCEILDIKFVILDMPKIYSSSELLKGI
jgi:cytidyltransferase-like protein